MKKLLLVVMLSFQSLSQSQQSGTIIGHLVARDYRAPNTGLRVGVRALEGSSFVGFVQTDESGHYRLDGIPPGRYYVAAGQSDSPTYYPGVMGLIDAQPVKVVSGSIVTSVDFTLGNPGELSASDRIQIKRGGTLPVFNVQGRIDGFPGMALPPIIRLTSLWQASRATTVNSDGTFEFSDVPRAQYQLRLGRDGVSYGRNFTVGNQDIAGIEIKSPVEVRGRIVMADGGNLPPIVFQIQTEYAASSPGSVQALAAIQREFDIRDDGTFVLSVVRGEQRISVLGLPAEYAIKSIFYGQTDLIVNPLSLSAPPTSEIVVTLDRTSASAPNFRIIFQYGHGSFFHANALDSFRGTLTKDMVGDPPMTFNFRLSDAELSQIEKKLDEMDFWNAQKFPTLFHMPNPGPGGCNSTGSQPMFLFVVRGQTSKELTWMDQDNLCGVTTTSEGASLVSLRKLIQEMIRSHPDYSRLPKTRSTYID